MWNCSNAMHHFLFVSWNAVLMEWKSAATDGQNRSALLQKTWTVTVMTSTCVMTELFEGDIPRV